MRSGDLVQPVTAARAGAVEPSAGSWEKRLEARLARERKARVEAEEIAERMLRDLYQRQRELELTEAVSAVANSAEAVEEAMQVTIDRICAYTGWPVGHVLAPRGGGAGVELVSTGIWHLDDPQRFESFRRVSEEMTFPPGVGLPGRIFESGWPAWIVDVTQDANFLRATAATDVGVRKAFGFPALAAEEVVCVLEFFSSAVGEPDESLLKLVRHVGIQLGRVGERTRAREELTRHAEELERHASELERANAELKAFAYAMSHDLSEPLRTVSSFAQLLSDRYAGRLGSDADEFIGFVVEGTERMQRLIDGLLDYSRVGSARMDLEAVDCNELLARVERDLAVSIAEADASVEVGELPTVSADPRQLERLFTNLISNAVKFHGPEPPRVRVAAVEDGRSWRFSVVDNGIGVEARHSERIFSVFQRLHARGEYAGTGIGLSVCQRIVERHGGRIWVEPAEGGGSAFLFTIPDLDEVGE